MLRAYKTEINPTEEQKVLINKTIGTCRFIYNFYIAHNKEVYETEKRFISGMDFSKWLNNDLDVLILNGMDFSKWLNNDFIPSTSDYSWIKEVSSKSVKKSIMDAEGAFKKFFKKQAKFPKFKKKGKSDVKMYFVKTDSKVIIPCERHRIKIPTLGWVQLKEKGYIPTNPDTYIIKSGTVSVKAGRYYVSVLVEQPDFQKVKQTGEGIGIDLGLKDFAVLSDGRIFKNINKTHVVRKLNKQLKRKQRSLSRKYEALKGRKGENATRQNIQKNLKLGMNLIIQLTTKKMETYIKNMLNYLKKMKMLFLGED